MRILTTILLFSVNLMAYSQESYRIGDILKKDSIISNRYKKGKIFFGGSPGGGVIISNKELMQFNINNSSEFGYFISDKTLLFLHSFYSFNKSVKNEHKGIDVWGADSRQSVGIRKYFHPKKISFFTEVGFDYNNFYSHFTFYNDLPAKMFHIGSVSGGAGVSLFIYKFDILIGLRYCYPILYKEEATKYSDFGLISGTGYVFGTYFSF